MAPSWPYRCIPCHRSGDPQPPFSPFSWASPAATPEHRVSALASHTVGTVPEHAADTGHNDWEAMDATTGEWVALGAYVGDGWFQREWEARPWHHRRTPDELAAVRAWESDPEPLPPGDYCALCGWRVPPGGSYCDHIALTGHNELGESDGQGRRLWGPKVGCHGCDEPPAGPVSEMWERVHRPP